MNYLKNISVALLYIIGIIIGTTMIITILNYFNIITGTTLTIVKILICVVSLFTGGIVIGRKSSKKGWLEGLKLSLIFLILLTIFNYLGLGSPLKLKNLLYYLIIIVSCVFGSIIGINKKIDNK